MKFIQGTPRNQLVLFNDCLDNIIKDNNIVRVIDAYIESLDLEKLNFKIPELKTGAPPYTPQLLLKIYLYGYYERIRSSRRLEKECNRNKELIWLTEELAPDFKTIADFRKNNHKGINNIFKEFLILCNTAGLLSLETVAIDGTKMRAQNSLNNIYRRNEIDKTEEKIQKKIDEYLSMLDIEDEKESDDIKIKESGIEDVVKKLKELKKHKNKIEEIKKRFEEEEELKVYFSTDKDSRLQSDKGKIRAGYNPQIAGDDKNKLIIVNDVSNKSNDLDQMTPMVEKVKEVKKTLGIKNKTKAIMDAGYFSEKEIMKNKDDNEVEIIVVDKKESEESKKKKNNEVTANKVPSKEFGIEFFIYDKTNDIYKCPEGKTLEKSNQNPGIETSGRKVFEYRCKECAGCKSRHLCTKNEKGRSIKISVNKDKMDEFKEDMKTEEKKRMIERRKEIIEHPFGTIKRNLGYTYFMQKSLEKVSAEFSFICFTYNFKRVLNILGVKKFIEEINKQKKLKFEIS